MIEKVWQKRLVWTLVGAGLIDAGLNRAIPAWQISRMHAYDGAAKTTLSTGASLFVANLVLTLCVATAVMVAVCSYQRSKTFSAVLILFSALTLGDAMVPDALTGWVSLSAMAALCAGVGAFVFLWQSGRGFWRSFAAFSAAGAVVSGRLYAVLSDPGVMQGPWVDTSRLMLIDIADTLAVITAIAVFFGWGLPVTRIHRAAASIAVVVTIVLSLLASAMGYGYAAAVLATQGIQMNYSWVVYAFATFLFATTIVNRILRSEDDRLQQALLLLLVAGVVPVAASQNLAAVIALGLLNRALTWDAEQAAEKREESAELHPAPPIPAG